MDIFRRSLPYKLVAADAANGRLAHAYLLVCPDEKNLRPFLKQLAKLVLRADARADRLIDAERYVDCRIFPAEGERAGVAEVKALLAELEKSNPEAANNIFRSMHNVALDCIVGWRRGGARGSFLDEY